MSQSNSTTPDEFELTQPLSREEERKGKRAVYVKAWQEANREKIAAQHKARYEAKKESIAAQHKAHYEANKEEYCARQKAYYDANKEKYEAYKKAWREANPDRHKLHGRKNHLQRKYGLTLDQFAEMLRGCDNRCQCCKTPFSEILNEQPRVDHCHSTGMVRGILCHRCNRLLGDAEDNPSILQEYARYLERRVI